jgi:hypothetical protein
MKAFYKQRIFEAYGYRCAVTSEKADDLHHVKPNTKINRKRWPLFINSPFNLIPIDHDYHMNCPLPEKPSDLVCDLYEEWLRELSDSCASS